MAAWLQGYADQIKYIQDNNIQPRQNSVRRAFSAVSSFVTSKWDQDEPYNLNCPMVDKKRCVTGCVTTAVSQILYHYAKLGYKPSSTAIPGYKTEKHEIPMPALSPTSFDWDSMKDEYNGSETQDQKNSIAKLFEYVGTGLEADYNLASNGGTSVYDDMPEIVFKKYFGYGNGIQLVRRMDATPNDEWEKVVYNEISNGRPVLYSGQGSGGGHSFIVHGYDGAGKYLINWGWGGYQDNYFALSALDPDGGGAGAGSSGYNYEQSALVGISPTDVTPYQISETVVLTTEYIELPAGDNIYTIPAGSSQFGLITIYARYISELSNAYNIEYNYKILKNGEFIEYLFKTSPGFSSFGPNYYFPYNPSGSRLDETSFYLPNWDKSSNTLGTSFKEPGTYKMIPVSREAGSNEWNENKGSDVYYLTGIVSSDMKLKLYVGEPGGSDPTPEVTQAELDELSALYAAQKAAINDKIAALTSNDTKLATIAQTLTEKKSAIDAATAKINDLKNKLNSNYLTAMQQSSYSVELLMVESKLSLLLSEYNAAQKDLSALQTKSAALKTTLNALLTTVNTESAVVATITTKAALDASKTKVANIKEQQTNCNVSVETAKVTILETTVSTLLVVDIDTRLVSLNTKIENNIAAAMKDEEEAKEEEAKAKLEEDKKALTEACDEMTAKLNEKQNALGTNEKSGLAIETAIKEAQDAIGPVEKKIAAIKESLKSDMLTAVQKADFNSRLETLEKAKSDYVDNVKSLSNALALASKENDQLKFTLDEIDAQIKDLQSTINAITTTDALNKAKEDADKVDAQLSGISAADVEKQLLSVLDNLGKLSLDDTVKELAALEEEVEKAIASGQEEYEKQQAEKLAKAKEAFEAAIAALDETIQSQEANYEKRLNVLSTVKATLAELDDAISQMKAKYKEIERKLQEIIDKQSSTRSDDSEVIEELKKKLTELKKHIETLESQREVIPGQIDQLDQQMKSYAAVIEEAKAAKQKMQADLSSATTADEVEKLSASVSKEKSELASKGLYWYNTLVDNCNIVVEYVNGFADNVNIVDKETKALEKLVEEVVTAINQLIINKSEIVARYDMKGNPVDSTYKGVHIIKLKNGKTIKLYVK